MKKHHSYKKKEKKSACSIKLIVGMVIFVVCTQCPSVIFKRSKHFIDVKTSLLNIQKNLMAIRIRVKRRPQWSYLDYSFFGSLHISDYPISNYK